MEMLELSRYRPEQQIRSQILGPLATNRPCLSNQSISKTQWLLREMYFLLRRSIIAEYFPGTVQPSQGEKRYQDMPDHAFSGKPTFAASSPSCFHFAERQPLALLVSSNPCFEVRWWFVFFFFFKKEQSVWGHPEAVQNAAFTVLQVQHLALTQWKL